MYVLIRWSDEDPDRQGYVGEVWDNGEITGFFELQSTSREEAFKEAREWVPDQVPIKMGSP